LYTQIGGEWEFLVATSYIGIGASAGGSTRDASIYFDTDARFWWDASENCFYCEPLSGIVQYWYYGYIYINAFTRPLPTNTHAFGDGTYYWTDVSAKSFTDRSAIWLQEPVSAAQIIKGLENETRDGFCAKAESRGQRRLRYSALPEWAWSHELEEAPEDIVIDEATKIADGTFEAQNLQRPARDGSTLVKKGELTRIHKTHLGEVAIAAEGFDLSAGVSILLGAVKGLIERVEALERKAVG
jgi:hypothetical protein